ncbi:cap-specific mRNA (nucleoside-2'-O-)-methyltransferase 2 isoform X1 [Stigmatopora nigra]
MISCNGTRKKVCKRGQQQVSSVTPCDAHALTEIEGLFSKSRTYNKPTNEEWCIPNANVALRQQEKMENVRLQALKVSLNSVKNQLSDKNIEVWHQHTSSTNRAGKVIATVRSAANAEICTQAWCKFYEILGTFSVLPGEALLSGELNTLHLCEAPGAFISALNHYVKTNERTRYCDWSWAANTLNPYHEANTGDATISDDRLIANTLPWWFFGSDNTGDIMLQKHLLELQTFVANMRRVDLVTADGSFDCQENPDEQEALVAPLHYCEVTAALLLLSPGGSLVLKMFTLYEHSSVCLLYLLNCCFGSVSVFKPATSKAGNSEVYVVCLDYRRGEAERPLLSKLVRNYGPHLAAREALFPESAIPPSFLTQHEEMCAYFHTLQVETIMENLSLFERMSDERRERLELIRDWTARDYLRRFQVTFLPRSRWISRNVVSPACCRASADRLAGPRKQAAGSFNERRELQNLGWKERVERSRHAECIKRHLREPDGTDCVLRGPSSDFHMDSWCIIVGAGLPVVRNSPFCSGILLNYVTEARAALTERDLSQVAPCDSCRVNSATSLLSEVATLCADSSGTKEKNNCLVLGSRAEWDVPTLQIEELLVTFPSETWCLEGGLGPKYDAAPAYQRGLVHGIVCALQSLTSGDALLLPVPAALTRVSAAVMLCLHACFRSMAFRCPPPSGGVGAVLLCAGFCPQGAALILPSLTEVYDCIGGLTNEAGDKQVLQFVSMEEVLNSGLTDFLRTMNSEIMRHALHLLVQV